jgi:hypothetical protein
VSNSSRVSASTQPFDFGGHDGSAQGHLACFAKQLVNLNSEQGYSSEIEFACLNLLLYQAIHVVKQQVANLNND